MPSEVSSISMRRLRRFCAAVAVVAALASCPAAFAVPPEDAAAIELGIGGFVAEMEASSPAKRMDYGELTVSLFLQAHGRAPSPAEFFVVRGVAEMFSATPEEMLSLVLREDQPGPTWEQCHRFLERSGAKQFQPSSDAAALAAALAATPQEELLAEMDAADGAKAGLLSADGDGPLTTPAAPLDYPTYFGYFHDHSELSLDAEGDPYEAYRTARDLAELDFYSLADHAEFLILWPWDNKWDILRDAANAAYQPHQFAALWGFEWSNPLLGHITVVNSGPLISAVDTYSLGSFHRWLMKQAGTFAHFNHPGDFDYTGQEFRRFRLFPEAVPRLVGMELWNESNGFDRYHYAGSWESDTSFFDLALQQGWRIAPGGGQDNHRRGWGLRNDFRIGVQARELTRDGIAEAFLARRFYSTEDKNLLLDFRSSGHPMGSRLAGLPRVFTVSVGDRSGDRFERVRLFRNGELVQEAAVSGNAVEAVFEDPDGAGNDYYSVIVTQADDGDRNGRNDEAISAPIWFEDGLEDTPRTPACGAVMTAGGGDAGDSGLLAAGGAISLLLVLLRRRPVLECPR